MIMLLLLECLLGFSIYWALNFNRLSFFFTDISISIPKGLYLKKDSDITIFGHLALVKKTNIIWLLVL